ncbi:DUF5107 domain-containing protein [Streptomyces litchfieldiae]|uniref:DUF5107 domain-containing protein n=1 Tax=Streptomyces litchfieldiae TaxID=3075543 RepID=A0ABU2MX65_9ACTN|nr:DUF5107 domain-containing protein [Streptomyces sp. DSM 44938]MDT0345972.1 DUF5107 domain-containing protein [Streptomyces sp. DSM 44938]
MARTVTTIRPGSLTLPAAALGPENPLPPLLPRDDAHRIDRRQRAALPADMARQIGWAPLATMLPTRLRDGYGRRRVRTELTTVVIENDRLRVTVLPDFGGRVHSLYHKPTGRDLLYTNPVLQPADFALNGAWFSGGIEWNIGATGHTTLSCAPVHAGVVPAPGGGRMLRLWEWERLRDTPFQVDLWLPDGSDFLYAGVRVRNPHAHTVPVYWWTNIAVPEGPGTRVLAPADEAWHFGYERSLRRFPVPEWDGADRSYPLHGDFPADYFYEVRPGARKWVAALDEHGQGFAQTSTALLRGRKLFVWGAGPGGRRWQRWLTEDGTPGYAEIQAGLARTQLEHVPLGPGAEFRWLEAFGPLAADPAAVHGADWAAATAHTERRLGAALPAAEVDAAYAAWLPYADLDPKETLHTASGWGALEVARAGHELPGTPFDPGTLGPDQRPWVHLLDTGRLPEETAAPGRPPGPGPVSPPWRERLECAPGGPLTDFHLGVAQWHARDHAQARRSWERSLAAGPSPWPLRCLALAEAWAGHRDRAAELARVAVELALDTPGVPRPALAALAREAVPLLLDAGRAADARGVFDRLPAATREAGRFRLLDCRILLAQGQRAAARAVFDAGFEVADLREGDETLSDTWAELTDDPLPDRYEFRMRPA